MKLTIVYDNEIFKKDLDLRSDWGFACLIQTSDEYILFDSGAKGNILLNNMKMLDIEPRDISKIIISHEHWDHNGGLKSIIPFVNDAELYSLEKNEYGKKIKHINVESPQMITKDIHTTGRLAGSPIDEQSLIIKGKKGWYILVGCSHPGVDKILQAAQKIGNAVGIIGGFHGFRDFSILEDLNFVCPCHCTKYKKEIKKGLSNIFSDCGVGKIIDLNEEE